MAIYTKICKTPECNVAIPETDEWCTNHNISQTVSKQWKPHTHMCMSCNIQYDCYSRSCTMRCYYCTPKTTKLDLDPGTLKERPATDIFKLCTPLLQSKAVDYTHADSNADYHSNFKVSQFLLDIFPSPYQSYAALIGTKLARLSVLLNKDTAMHESIEDSFIDCINYIALMYERYKESKQACHVKPRSNTPSRLS